MRKEQNDAAREVSEFDSGAEPVAVLGMGCRFPGGVDSPADFWRLLIDGTDPVGELPPDRWPANQRRAGTSAVGGFRSGVHDFDAAFFGLSPREAALMDPQQRMVLEVSWEAMENAGIPPTSLAGSDTGVFVGVNADDHGREVLADLPRIEAWTGIGASLCAVANRVSHALDLRGPSMAVDTACSASLVAVHLAAQSLRAGECEVALAGGVLLMLAPGLTAVMGAAGALSASGRSRAFDAAADGYVRGEGAGIVVLKRLSAARRDGDRVLAVLRGGAVRQDGRTDGIMAPSRSAQADLFRVACRSAGVDPSEVDYVEAHGTGTPVGDPIELAALAEVYGVGRSGSPCRIGSVKSNIGHLEAASGVAGLIKTVLAMRHRTIPANLHFTAPNPVIDWAGSGLRVVDVHTPWPERGGTRLAAVSGYGYGGTIAHLIVESAPEPEPGASAPVSAASVRLFPVSGASAQAVRDAAARLADWLTGAGNVVPLADVAHTLSRRRAHLGWRASVVAADRDELVARLGTVEPVAVRRNPGPVWVFSGHGSQWPGMGRELLATEPVFRAVLDRLGATFRAEGTATPLDLFAAPTLSTADTQLAIFAVQLGLAAVWRRYGVEPAAVLGHSVGEIAAAVVAGALTEEHGARLVCRRSALLRRLEPDGAMAVVNIPFPDTAARLADRPGVVPAIDAAPRSAVLAGNRAALADVLADWRRHGVFAQEVATDIAFHGPHVTPLLAELAAAAADLTPAEPRIPLYSTVLADPRDRALRDGDYWAANLGRPVRFRPAIDAALADGYRVFLEVAPHPVVTSAVADTASAADGTDVDTAYTLRRNRPERATLLANLGRLHDSGVDVDWTAIQPDGALAELPTMPWQHRTHRVPGATAESAVAPHDPASGHLLGGETIVHGPTPTRVWHTVLDESSRPYPGHHPVLGTEIVPAAVLLHTFLHAARTTTNPPALADVVLRAPVPVDGSTLQVSLADGRLRLSSRPSTSDNWRTHTAASVTEPRLRPSDTAVLPELPEQLAPHHVLDTLTAAGVGGMGFPWQVTELARGDAELRARVHLADPAAPGTTTVSALDAALSIGAVAVPGPPTLRMPAHIARVDLPEPVPADVLIRIRPRGGPTVDAELCTVDGRRLGSLSAIRYGTPDGDPAASVSPRRLVHEIRWTETAVQPRHRVDRVILLRGDGDRTPLPDLPVPVLELAHPEDLDDIRDELTAATVIAVAPGTGKHVGVAAFRATWLLIRTATRLAAWPSENRPRLWCLSRGVQAAQAESTLSHSSLWGVARVLAGEHPDLWGGLVDLDDDPDPGRLLNILRSAPDDLRVLRGDTVSAPRLAPLAVPAVVEPLRCRPDGTYLITGGLGALGREVAHWLAERGARRLVLASRHGLPPRELWDEPTDPERAARIACVRSLEAAGVTVRAPAVDLTDRVQAPKLLSCTELGLPPYRGVVHAAGVLDNRLVTRTDALALIRVMRPKIAGAQVLHDMFPPGSLDFLTLFSSAGPLLGLPGQAGYAAANAFLDSLAAHRRAHGCPATTSLSWTSWRGLGMSTSSADIDPELHARGTADITADDAFAAWDHAQHHPGHVVVLRTIHTVPDVRRPALLRDLPGPATHSGTGTTPASTTEACTPATVRTETAALIAAELGVPIPDLDPAAPLVELGVDSVLSQAIRRALERRFGVALPVNLFWDKPTAHAVAAHLTELLLPEGGSA